jgi:hypothetical protein
LSASRQSGQGIGFVGVPDTEGNADHISDGHYQRMPVSVVAHPRFERTTCSLRRIARPRRAQLSVRHDRRNHDRSIAGLGTDKAQRYFAPDFDRLSDRLLDAGEIAVVEVVSM